MLNIEGINHIGIRVRDKQRSIAFYQTLGFTLKSDTGFESGHPVIMEHPGGVVINLLGPANGEESGNILMDTPEKHTGITHIALTVQSLDQARALMEQNNMEVTGSFTFKTLSAIFIRDPDRTVIELDEWATIEQ